jgi:hypothetical protein
MTIHSSSNRFGVESTARILNDMSDGLNPDYSSATKQIANALLQTTVARATLCPFLHHVTVVNGAVSPTAATVELVSAPAQCYDNNSNNFQGASSATETRKIEQAARKYIITVNRCSRKTRYHCHPVPRGNQRKALIPNGLHYRKWSFSNPETMSTLDIKIVNRNEQDKRVDVDRENFSKDGKKTRKIVKNMTKPLRNNTPHEHNIMKNILETKGVTSL